jgi:two-component system sensor histidine kinase ChvG
VAGAPVLLGAGREVLTAVATVAGRAGCWAVVIGTAEARLQGVASPDPYWQRPEARAALAIYALMAGLVALIFSGVWRALLRMRRLAAGEETAEGFAETARVPELATLAAAFDAMVVRLRRSAEMMRQAAEANAHAFKGPIGTIRQALEPLRRHDDTARWLEPVDAALNRLDGLVRSARVLDSAAAELLEPELEAVDLSELASAVVDGFASSHPGRVAGAVALGVVVRAQVEALETVLENLIENAMGFSPPGRPVRVALRREGTEAVLTVEDDGPGVAPERLAHIFERYYSHRPGQAPGAHFGIGLWLVRQHVLLLGGAIAAVNRRQGGLSVEVRLPLAG